MIRIIDPPATSSSSTASALALSQHVISTNFVITAGNSAYVVRYIEIGSGITLEIGSDSDLEIG